MSTWLTVTASLLMISVNIKSCKFQETSNVTSWPVSYDANVDYQPTIEFLSSESCRLRSKRYISNGLCTSPKPISEVVCAETCTMPANTRIPYSFHLNSLRKRRSSNNLQLQKSIRWKCTEASVRKKRVKLICRDGTIRGYGIRLVTSCQCNPIQSKKTKSS